MSNAIHSFLPWARRGLSAQIQEVEIYDGVTQQTPNANERATIGANINIKVNNNQTPLGSPLPKNLQIIGPGDVIGIHPDVIVKTEPRDWITNFEPHSFPFIDFYEEDFPWRYSPATATPSAVNTVTEGGKLRPWLTLIVLKEDEFKRTTVANAPLNAIALDASITADKRPLPKNDEVWAWAHVSINEELAGINLQAKIADLNAQVSATPSIAISRIICPRKLEENTSYNAFLIPTYETGRLAGLGITIPIGTKAQAPAWDHDISKPAWPTWPASPAINPLALGVFPIYHEWYFRTGATGDFEYLVRQVKPRIANLNVGKRLMDIQAPGYGLFYTAGNSGTTAGTELLEGALVVPGNNAPTFAQEVPPNPTTPEGTFRDSLSHFVNLGEDMLNYPLNNPMMNLNYPTVADPTVASDPIIAPPLYGRWHALRSKADPYNNPNVWLNELNLDPRYRVAASMGGDYVRKNQESLMNEAWNQVGAVLKSNRDAALAQLALAASQAMHAKHIASQPIEQLLPMTNNVHAKISTASTTTLQQNMRNSSLPASASSSAFRKISRPTGTLVKRLNPVINTPTNNTMGKMIQGNLAPVAAKQAPGTMAYTFAMSSLNTAIANVQSVANPSAVPFNISLPAGPPASPNTTVSVNFQSSFSPYTNVFDSANWTSPAGPPNLTTGPNVISDSINPGITHVNSFYACISVNSQPYIPPTPDAIVPVMAAPLFILPMYESVKDLGTEFLIPNLKLIPQNSVTLLESNQKFIEAFLAGANYEMGRELLWREYPTDQRGTYFKHFWASTDSPTATEANTPDISPIHTWVSTTLLGTHSLRTGTGSNNLVLAIRGDFLKKFPNAVIYSVQADWDSTQPNKFDAPRIVKTDLQGNEIKKYPIFSAKIDPDITFLGFDITAADAKGSRTPIPQTPPLQPLPPSPGWFFVILERPGELHFGLDEPAPVPQQYLHTWNDLAWNQVSKNNAGYLHLTPAPQFATPTPGNPVTKVVSTEPTDTNWAEDAGAMAQVLYQNPSKVLIHANEMIP